MDVPQPIRAQLGAACFNVLNWCHTFFFLFVCLFVFWPVCAQTAALWLSCTVTALASPQHPRLARIRVASWRSCFPAKSSLTDHSLLGKKHTPPYSGDPNLWLRNTVFKKWELPQLPDRFVRSAADPSTWLSDDRLLFSPPSKCGCLLLSEQIAMDKQARAHVHTHPQYIGVILPWIAIKAIFALSGTVPSAVFLACSCDMVPSEPSLEGYMQHIWLMARLSGHAHANHLSDWLCRYEALIASLAGTVVAVSALSVLFPRTDFPSPRV